MRVDGVLKTADVRVRGVRRMFEETATLERLFDNVVGHLLNAPNMMDDVTRRVRRWVVGVRRVSQNKVLMYWNGERRLNENRLNVKGKSRWENCDGTGESFAQLFERTDRRRDP